MKRRLVFGAGRGPRLAVLEQIKRSGEGLSVKELATVLGMSYMGVKAHCVALVSSGHLITRRQPATKGRPSLLYRLADSGERLFAESGDALALDLLKEASGLFGPTAPQKLLVMFFRSLQKRYQEMIPEGGASERARMLVRIRDHEGRMSRLEERRDSWEIHESHNPLAAIMNAYPEARTLEEHLFSELLNGKVKRREEGGKVIFAPIE